MKFLATRSASAVMLIALAICAPVAHGQQKPPSAKPHLTVYKSPTCGCCAKWVEYMQANGFTAAVTDMPDVTPVKMQHGLPARLASCHTTLVGGYVIEGHVPVGDIRRLLKEKPAVAGLAAPGMPAGSPGMDVPNSPPYDVVSFDKDGRTRVYASHK
jgi:hypothetical protein